MELQLPIKLVLFDVTLTTPRQINFCVDNKPFKARQPGALWQMFPSLFSHHKK